MELTVHYPAEGRGALDQNVTRDRQEWDSSPTQNGQKIYGATVTKGSTGCWGKGPAYPEVICSSTLDKGWGVCERIITRILGTERHKQQFLYRPDDRLSVVYNAYQRELAQFQVTSDI